MNEVHFCILEMGVMEFLLQLVERMLQLLADAMIMVSIRLAHRDMQRGRREAGDGLGRGRLQSKTNCGSEGYCGGELRAEKCQLEKKGETIDCSR
jgi:hypothetical protein